MIVLAPYELPVAVAGSLEEAKVKETLEGIKKLIIDSKGEVGEVEEWGKKNLAHELKKEKTGFYFLVNFEADGKTIPIIDKKLKLQENTLRFLILKKQPAKKIKEKKVKASKEAAVN